MSQYTSFVAVEERVVNVGGKQRTVDVPVEMPEGVAYEGIFGERRAALAAAKHVNLSLAYGTARPAALGRGVVGGAGGFPGGGSPASAAASAPLPAPIAAPGRLREQSAATAGGDISSADGVIREGAEEARKLLDAMKKPEERRDALRNAKLAPALRALAAKADKAGESVEVQVWLNALPPDGLAKLKALGFELSATLTPNKLLLGTVAAGKLDALAELGFVRFVEPPRFR
jgi:Ca-activated chloride channel family protein